MFSTYLNTEEIDEGEFEPPVQLPFPEHEEFAERIRRTLYYGNLPDGERPSYTMSELAVGYFRESAPRELGKIDLYWAADVSRKAFISPCSMMLSMIYIERLKHKNPEYLNQVSSSDLFLISMMVASKYLYDEGIDEEVYNDEWAESANMDVKDVNRLERDFLKAIDWSLFTEQEDFERVLKSMEQRIALSQGLDRGSWSYSDLWVLLNSAGLHGTLRHVLEELCRVVLVCSVAYTAGALTVLASITTVSFLHHQASVLTTSQHDMTTADVPHSSPPYLLNKNLGLDADQLPFDVAETDSILPNQNVKDILLPHVIASLGEKVPEDQNSSTADPVAAIDSGQVQTEDGNCNNSTRIMDDGDQITTKSILTFPGFLTLALIKDTVTQFLTSTGQNSNAKYGEDKHSGESIKGKAAKCMCARCPLKNKGQNSRRRRLIKGQGYGNKKILSGCVLVPPYTLWSSLQDAKCCKKNSSKGQRNVGQSSGGNSGYTGSTDATILNEGSEIDNDENIEKVLNLRLNDYGNEIKSILSKGQMNQCAVRGRNPVLLPCRVESNFVELTSRFETSSQVAIIG